MKVLARRILEYEIWLLRLAVAFPLVWAGVGSILHPENWIGFIPSFVGKVVEPEVFLIGHGFLWLLTAAGILFGFLRPLFAAVAAAGLISILIFFGVDDITFRDVGLAIVAFVLFLKELEE